MKERLSTYLSHLLKILKLNRNTFLTLCILAIVLDIILIKDTFDLIIFSIILFYCFATWLYKLRSKFTYFLCLGLFAIMYFGYLFTGASVPTEKAAVWLYLFLLTGIVQQIRE